MSMQLFLDFEFTMPGRNDHGKLYFPEIIEAGILLVKDLTIVEKYSTYVKPIQNPTLSNKCKSFLSISQEDVDGGIEFGELINQFHKLSRSCSEVVTWGNSDRAVLMKSCMKWGKPYPFSECKWVDFSLRHQQYYGLQQTMGLKRALEDLGVKGSKKRHRALDDAEDLFELYLKINHDKQRMTHHKHFSLGDRIDFSMIKNKLFVANA